LWPPDLSLVVTASSDHVPQWSVWGGAHHFSNEVRLSGRNHISYAWDRLKHLTYSLVLNLFFFDRARRYLEDTSDATMEENLKLIEL
jgi:hypothetical protein